MSIHDMFTSDFPAASLSEKIDFEKALFRPLVLHGIRAGPAFKRGAMSGIRAVLAEWPCPFVEARSLASAPVGERCCFARVSVLHGTRDWGFTCGWAAAVRVQRGQVLWAPASRSGSQALTSDG